jgi:hypothetical protein
MSPARRTASAISKLYDCIDGHAGVVHMTGEGI